MADLISGRIRVYYDDHHGIPDNVVLQSLESTRSNWIELFDKVCKSIVISRGMTISNHTTFVPYHKIKAIKLELD